jgi:hypothetical protein
VTPLSIELTRDQVVAELASMDLDWGDEEDATSLVDLLSERFTVTEAWTWIVWIEVGLGGRSPLAMLRDGRSREVFALARVVVAG